MTLSASDWELLHREIDGEATEIESAGLRERLAGEPELRAAFQALVGVGRSLTEAGFVDPPPQLSADVMRQVRLKGATPGRWEWLAPLTGWVVQNPALALASSLAVGLVAGLLTTGLSDRGLAPLDGTSVSGTLLPPGQLARLPVMDEARLEGPGIRANAVTRHAHGTVVAEVEILSSGPVDVTLDVDARRLGPRGFECLGDEPTGGVVIEPGRVHVRQATAGRCFVNLAVLGPDPGPVRVRVQAGLARAEATLRTGAAGE